MVNGTTPSTLKCDTYFCATPKTYPSDLSDEQWELLKDFVAQGSMRRPRKVDVREVINAILYPKKMS